MYTAYILTLQLKLIVNDWPEFMPFLVNLLCSPALVAGCVRTLKTTTGFEEHLTEDNQEFMRKSMAEEYRRQTADKLNPLKDEPWPRHEWTEGGRHECQKLGSSHGRFPVSWQ